jgi:hypothetical protein
MNWDSDILNVSAGTHVAFDNFAATIMDHHLMEISTPIHGIAVASVVEWVISEWKRVGLAPHGTDRPFSVLDKAALNITTALKQRGFSFAAILSVMQKMRAPMYRDISMLQFAVLFCKAQIINSAVPTLGAPMLVIDNDGRICMCLPQDLPVVLSQQKHMGHSYTMLNLCRVFTECDFNRVIAHYGAESFIEAPHAIVARLCRPETRRITINLVKRTIETSVVDGPMPEYAALTQKLCNRGLLASRMVIKEPLDGEPIISAE